MDKGLGQKALALIVEAMKRERPATDICLSTSPDNVRGRHVYQKAGFVPTGETCGAEDDIEECYRLTV